MQAIKKYWKHALFALAVFGFISSASSGPHRPAAGARKEGKQITAEKGKKRAAKKKTQVESTGGKRVAGTPETNNEVLERQKEGAEEDAEAAE